MENVARRADGRRIFSAPFKQEQLARVERGEVTMAELARELGGIPGLVREHVRGSLLLMTTDGRRRPLFLPNT